MAMNSTSDVPNVGRQKAWWFESAPPPLRRSLTASILILVPALLGAVFEWPRYVTYALLVPGFSLEIAFGWAAARAHGAEYRKARPSRGVLWEVAVASWARLSLAFTRRTLHCYSRYCSLLWRSRCRALYGSVTQAQRSMNSLLLSRPFDQCAQCRLLVLASSHRLAVDT